MTRYVALLRAVNVGGTVVRMEALRGHLESLGLTSVTTLLQSGNVVFQATQTTSRALEELLERTTASALGVETTYFVRSAAEWGRLAAANPFREEAERDPAHLHVSVLKTAPPDGSWARLEAAIVGRERVRAGDRAAYIVYPDGSGTSKFTLGVIERTLGTRGTNRNWNTVTKLARLVGA